MSLKSVEMQIALPRTHEAGKISNQQQQQGQLLQEHAAENTEKQLERKRKMVHQSEQKEELHLKERQSKEHSPVERQHQNQKNKKKRQKESKHPYKGKQIDISG
ncbi:sRNA-binding protein [Oikeobacillus pervagus]|uniref:SRNA-binding protein n=1 Tax=Oikeobacillus pervagus TaxID=1325931 RepID=A0AAJ1WI45_9BACI|nr:hypothetical protein [Oikeobacillus pervagus]MDQ0214275.1 sRNA-binding protein [Oikeobacillus pervagus]